MQVATEHALVTAEPGSSVDVTVDVVNTGDLIDGVTASVLGWPEEKFHATPKLLPLFPDAQGQIVITIDVPTSQPAGLHALTVELTSPGAGNPTQYVDVSLSVSARPAVELSVTPRLVRARRSGRFVVTTHNAGNVALDATLHSRTDDRRTEATFTPAHVHLEAGASASAVMVVRGPRMITGAEADRTVAVSARAQRVHAVPELEEPEPALERTETVQLRQRPTLSRGLLTALILAGIVALWALVFLLGIVQVLGGDPLTKSAPASFFPTAESAAGDGLGTDAPAGALPQTGLLPPGVGGEITGMVRSASNGQPAGRILVEAYRDSIHGPRLVSSAATQGDGTYSLAGLFPTSYRLKFNAAGFEPVWYPASPGPGRSTSLPVQAQGTTEGRDVVISGRPAQITGSIDPGPATGAVEVVVTARMVDAIGEASQDVGAAPQARTTTSNGDYTLTGLPAPATYELSFRAPGYQTTKVTTRVTGGEDRLQPKVLLGAGTGQINGTVNDGSGPIGGVTVSTTVDGEEVAVIPPTVGSVGSFSLTNLPTPGTYVVTFSAPDHGQHTTIIDLAGGESSSGLDVALHPGTGSISGMVLGPNGQGVGGVDVFVGGTSEIGAGATATPAATTLTTGDVGGFTINGLDAPGAYTLTFVADGFSPETIPVTLSGEGPADNVRATLRTRLGEIQGAVTGPEGKRYVGATVTASNGHGSWTAVSSAPGGSLAGGGYRIVGLEPGTYSVTVTASGLLQQTAIVTVASGQTARRDLTLRRSG
jgi:hypothetical protein